MMPLVSIVFMSLLSTVFHAIASKTSRVALFGSSYTGKCARDALDNNEGEDRWTDSIYVAICYAAL
jgi:hypothetical protein